MSASGAGGSRVRRLFDRAADADSLTAIIFRGIGAVLLTIGTALSSGIFTVADLLIIPINALGDGGADLVGSLFGGAATIIDFGALTTALAVGPSGWFNVGPFGFGLAVGAVLLALWVTNAYVGLDTTGNLIPGIPFDIPTPGFLGPEEEEE